MARFTALLALSLLVGHDAMAAEQRPRAREAGIVIGRLPTGPLNAITDVPGVRVGQVTVVDGTAVHTGVTAILPHEGNLFLQRVPAAIEVGNGFGKLLGISQVGELGELETPILLTGTLAVWKAADAFVSWLLQQPGMQDVRSINPVVGETNDGFLNDIRSRPLKPEQVAQALDSAQSGAVAEGSVGAGAGTVAFGWKGGIGTSSRRLPRTGYTVGVLVQSNFGGHLTVAGVPMEGKLPDPRQVATLADARQAAANTGDGSIMMVVATDAPLDSRLLTRLARRALTGLARTGSNMSNGSGDYVIAFSNAPALRHAVDEAPGAPLVANEAMGPLFEAVAEATEEAVLNSLFKATTVKGHRGTSPALPLEPVLQELRKAGALSR